MSTALHAVDETAPRAGDRDPIIDLLRSGATTTVVLWHWVFTILVWRPDGPHADNPIGYVSGLWSLTWVLQVMPLFFMAGGFTHSLAWRRARDTPGAWRRFATRRTRQLVVPALVLVTFVTAALVTIGAVHDGKDQWVPRAIILVLSPLWFLLVFLVLVLTVPLWDRLDHHFGELVPLGLAACAVGVDVLRFRYHIEWIAWANFVFVWAACHQVGWSWQRLRAAPSRFGHALVLLGFTALVGLTNMGLYPRSMVGTTSALDKISNMGPPTLPILALATLQIGLVVSFKARLDAWAALPRVHRAMGWLSTNAMPIFLWHTVGFTCFFMIMRAVWTVPAHPTFAWWVTRPLWVLGPAIFTAPLILLSRRLMPGASAITATAA